MRRRAVAVLRYLRRTKPGGAFDYLALFADGVVHPKLLRSGTTPEEERRPLPGDDLVALPMWEATRAVTIDAAPAEVWPWVAQMGYGRGGWYGWNPLEQGDPGVNRLLPDLPPPKAGDVWLDGPGCTEAKGAFTVRTVEAPRTLVLYSRRDPFTGREVEPPTSHLPIIETGWAFHLQALGRARTRLVARTRIAIAPRWALPLLKWMGVGDTVMQRRLLDGIKARVEAASRASGGHEGGGHGTRAKVRRGSASSEPTR